MSRDRSAALTELLRRRGAVFTADDEAPHAVHFGQPDEEYERLVDGCGWVVRSWASRLILTGADRVRFLNGMTTCDLAPLAPGDGTYGFVTSAKGRILADAVVRAGDDRLDLELPEGSAGAIAEHLGHYVVADRVELEQPEDRVLLELAGPEAPALLERALGQAPPSGWGRCEVDLFGVPLTLASGARFGVAGFAAWVEPGVLDRLLDASHADPCRPAPIGRAAWETVRVERGALLFGHDFGPDNLPQETGLDDAVSYTKGCYLGQEVVARLHYRGKPRSGPRGLEIAAEELPAAGVAIHFEGREAGRLTSVVRSPARGGGFGLSLLQRRAWEPGSIVDIEGGGEATVVAL